MSNEKVGIVCTSIDNGFSISVPGMDTLTITLGQLNDDIILAATLHGLKQKLMDAAALSRNPDNGRSATAADKLAAVSEVAARLLTGSWNKGRTDGETSGTGGLLFRALCIVYDGKTPAAIKTYLADKTPQQKAALRDVPAIAAQIAILRSSTAKVAAVDTDALLSELN